MDYITRRAAAAAGHRGALVRGWPRAFLRLSALGVRVERDRTVYQPEIAQALRDLQITIELPSVERIPAPQIEESLSEYTPEFLERSIDAFLDQLSMHANLRAATRRLRDLPEPERTAFGEWLNEWRCTAPVMPDVPPGEDAFYEWEYKRWKQGKPSSDWA